MAANRYRNWKCHCHAFYKQEGGELPFEFAWRPEQWAWLCEHFKDTKFISRSVHCSTIRKSKKLNHHLGKTTLEAKARKFMLENHHAPHIAAFEEAYGADPNGSMLVSQVKGKLQVLLEDRSFGDEGSVLDPLPDEDQHAIINDVLNAYKGTNAPSSSRTRTRVGPTIADLRAELERVKAESDAALKAKEAESKAALENMEGRLKAIENMVQAGFGVTGGVVNAQSEGASFVQNNLVD